MIEDIDKYVNFMSRNEISANQFLLCFLLYSDEKIKVGSKEVYPSQKIIDEHNINSPIANLFKYIYSVGITEDEINDLIQKGFIENHNRTVNEKQQMFPEFFKVTGKFVDQIFTSDNDFEEFWESYPTYVNNFANPNGPKINLRASDKDRVEDLYKRKIKTKSAHKRLISITKRAYEQGLINMNIEKYLGSEAWKEIESQLKDTQQHDSYGLKQA